MSSTGDFDEMDSYTPFEGVDATAFSTPLMTVTRYEIETGKGFPLHRHPEEQVVVMETGEAEFTIGDQVHRLGPGSWAAVPPNIDHGLKAGSGGCRFICIVAPPRKSADDYEIRGDVPA